MGSSWCLEARHAQTGDLHGSWTDDSPELLHLIETLAAEPDLPEDASLDWCEPIRYDKRDASDQTERYRWCASEIVPGAQWVRDLVAHSDPRVVSKQDLARGLQPYLLARVDQMLEFLRALDDEHEVRCLSLP